MDVKRIARTLATSALIFVAVALCYLFCNLVALICLFSPWMGISLFAAVAFIGTFFFLYRVH